MSLVPNNLRSPADQDIFFETEVIDRASLNDRFDSLLQFNKLIKAITIENKDGANIAQVRTQSPSESLRDIPIGSQRTIVGWTSFVQVLSDVVTGDWQMELDLVDPLEAKSKTQRNMNQTMNNRLMANG